MKLNLTKYLQENPLNYKYIKHCLDQITNKAGKFIKIKCKNDILQHYTLDEAKKLYLDDSDLVVKGGGEQSMSKSLQYLYQSRNKIIMYIGLYEFKNILIISNIYKKFQVIAKKPKVSTILLTINHNPPKNNNGPIQFSEQMLSLVGVCTNLVGSRSINWCSHICTGAKYFQNIMDNNYPNIIDPTPKISKKYKSIVNIGPWVGKKNKLKPIEIEEYLEEIFSQNKWENTPENVGYNYEMDELDIDSDEDIYS
jgi:hypothetical protein